MARLVVVGAGISGLAAAWAAAEAGLDVLVIEAAARVGGKLQVGEVAGIPVDVGAEAVLTVRPEALELIDALGLTGERIAPSTLGARVRAGGRTAPLPSGTTMGVPSDLEALRASGLLSDAGFAAVEAEATLPPLPPLEGDVAVRALVRERMGDEVVDRLVQPLLGGVYAGRADALSLAATVPALHARLTAGGSLLEAARPAGAGTRAADGVFTTLRGGLGRLPEALAASGRFEVRTSVTVRAIRRTPGGFALDCGSRADSETIECEAVVVAAPAAKAARLLAELAPAAAGELAAIQSASMAIVTFAFDGVELPPGSGVLVASGERMAVKATTLSSQKWPLETGGLSVLRASVGRSDEPHALRLDDADLTELVRRELGPLLGVTAAPVDSVVTRWGGGLPQYAVGHLDAVARIRAAVAEVPGLAVCGAAYDGVGIPACIASARAAVARIVDGQVGGGHWSHD